MHPKLGHTIRSKLYFAKKAWTGTLREGRSWSFPIGGVSACRNPIYTLFAGSVKSLSTSYLGWQLTPPLLFQGPVNKQDRLILGDVG